jgi:shikimate dehydrogenase
MQQLRIYDIDCNKSIELKKNLEKFYPNIRISTASSIENLEIDQSDLLINTSPVGMKKDDPCLVDGSLLHEGIFVYDLIYNPKETRLLKSAKAKGCGYANGLGMLLYQGALSFKLFTGQEAPLEIMRKALKEGVDKL